MSRLAAICFCVALGAAGFGAVSSTAGEWGFTDVTVASGFDHTHGFGLTTPGALRMSGGVAAGDFDRDGWIDLFVVCGTAGPARLYRNLGNGTFEDVAAAAGVALPPGKESAPTFVDLDGDGWLDLFVGGMQFTPIQVFRNRGDGTFEDVSTATSWPVFEFVFGTTFADVDHDGDLDAFVAQWNNAVTELLWRNEGGFVFTPASADWLEAADREELLFTFTGNFSDVNGDGWLDLLVAGDFNHSQVLLHDGVGGFDRVTDPGVFIDTNGMGAAVADYDRDGDLDFFVTSIGRDPEAIGNRLYRNRGDGSFDDVTAAAGVSFGFWGWGACAGDFDLDGDLDLFHVNGFTHAPFEADPSRLFVQEGDLVFVERAFELGIDDPREGRGVVCFDYDRDGDLDLFVANFEEAAGLFRNDLPAGSHYLVVDLEGPSGNPFGIGARVEVTVGAGVLVEEMRAGNNYVSQNPSELHFGLAEATRVSGVEVLWPGGLRSSFGATGVDEETMLSWSVLFADGFEGGDAGSWSAISP